jgi:hypothetical protein
VATIDFVRHLEMQFGFIETSAREYDAGNLNEAIRIATSLRIIFHQTSTSTSILTHLNSNNVRIATSLPPLPRPTTGTWTPLVQVSIPIHYADGKVTGFDTPEYKPKLGSINLTRQVVAADWWADEPAFLLKGKKVSRSDIVKWAANKDGGAHVDGVLPLDYLALHNEFNDLMQIDIGNPQAGGASFSCENAHLAALRQMAYEILSSPELLELAGR